MESTMHQTESNTRTIVIHEQTTDITVTIVIPEQFLYKSESITKQVTQFLKDVKLSEDKESSV
jgi:hypothetical protein